MVNKLKKYFKRELENRNLKKRVILDPAEMGVEKYVNDEDYFMKRVQEYENLARDYLKAGRINAAEKSLYKAKDVLERMSYEGVLYRKDGKEVRKDKEEIERAKDYLNRIDRNIKRLEALKEGKSNLLSGSGLERKSLVFMIFIIAGIVLSFIYLAPTGNAIGTLVETTPILLGVFLFVFGVVGLMFNLKRKKKDWRVYMEFKIKRNRT